MSEPTYGQSLAIWMLTHNVKGKDFAARVGMDPSQLSHYTRSRVVPGAKMKAKIEKAKGEIEGEKS